MTSPYLERPLRSEAEAMTEAKARAQPGPWRRDEYGHLMDANGERLTFCDVAIKAGNIPDEIEKAVANTDLAMAAPELVESLEIMRDDFCSRHCINLDDDHFNECLDATTALAHARGETP